jgi:DNA modification methylase
MTTPNLKQIESIPLEALIPYANNSRTHSDVQVAQIAASIREFGFTNPVLIDRDGTIVAGHGRVLAARKLGFDAVPCIRLGHLTPAQVKAYVIADNKLALNAGWDEELLKIELKGLEDEGFDLSLTGFSPEELAEMLVEFTAEGKTDPDDVPEPKGEPVTRLGDLWLMGNHRLHCGDSCSVEAVAKLMNGDKADLWITDPPYNVGYTGGTEDKLEIMNDEMDNDSFRTFLRAAYTAADQNLRAGAVFYIWHADTEGYNFRGAAVDIGWKLRQTLIWVKNALVLGHSNYQWKHEPCIYGWTNGEAHLWNGDRKQTTVLDFKKPQRNGEHPTMKPVELFAYQIANSSNPGQLVLDSFGGSGTTMIACEQSGRKSRLMELDPHYCDVIIRRWQNFTGKKAILESSGKSFDELAPADATSDPA